MRSICSRLKAYLGRYLPTERVCAICCRDSKLRLSNAVAVEPRTHTRPVSNRRDKRALDFRSVVLQRPIFPSRKSIHRTFGEFNQ